MSSLHYSSLSHVSERLRAKQVSPLELLDSQLARIAALQPKLNAFLHLDPDAARTAALYATERLSRNTSVGRLHGIPLTIKSCFDVIGWPNAAGSLLRAEEIPSLSATIVDRLRAAGAILVGTTNTPEFLMAYETDNRLTGRTSNPWNLARSAGGSSGGEAAAIAAGLSFGGVGSDGGGSARVPAHFCGICGLKPTPGRIPSTGHFPPGNNSYGWIGVVGPMARTVADLRILFNILAGPDPTDALTVPAPRQEISADPARETRIRALDLWWFFFGTLISQLFVQAVAGKESQLSPIFLDYMNAARPETPTTLLDFVAKSTARDFERARILRAMEEVPVLLSPVSQAPAFRHGEGIWRSGPGKGPAERIGGYRETMRHSQWLNLAGLPGLTIP